MTDYSISVSSPTLGGRAVATFDTLDGGEMVDVTSITTEWRDQTGLLLETLTRTTVDVSGTDIYGNASTITDIAGVGTYEASLVVDATNYTPPDTGYTWTLTIIIVKSGVSKTRIFSFQVIPTSLTISLESTGVAAVVMRQTGLVEDVVYVANNASTIISLRSGPVYGILAAYKNGVAITNPTGYAWSLFRTNVTVASAPAVNDHFVFTVQKRSTVFVLDIVNRAIQEVVRSLQPHYDVASSAFALSPSLVEITKAIAIGQLKQDLSEGVALESAFYRSGSDLQREARKQIIRIQRGEEGIYDTAGEEIARRNGSIVGGYLATDGLFHSRLQRREALAESGLYISLRSPPYWPYYGNPETGPFWGVY